MKNKRGEKMGAECKGENTVSKTIKICCDARKDDCPYAFEIKRENIHFFVCCRDLDMECEKTTGKMING